MNGCPELKIARKIEHKSSSEIKPNTKETKDFFDQIGNLTF